MSEAPKYDPVLIDIIKRYQPYLYLKAVEDVTGVNMDKPRELLRIRQEKEKNDTEA